MQGRLWRIGYFLLTILILACGLIARCLSKSRTAWISAGDPDSTTDFGSGPADAAVTTKLTLARCLWWLLLVFIPSSWLMGVTTYLTTDLAAIPLFWTIPLAIYLLSFIFAFAHSGAGVVRAATWLLPYVVVPLVLVMSAGFAHVVVDSPPSAGVFRRVRGMPRRAGAVAAGGAAGERFLRDDRRRRSAGRDLQRTRGSGWSSTE